MIMTTCSAAYRVTYLDNSSASFWCRQVAPQIKAMDHRLNQFIFRVWFFLAVSFEMLNNKPNGFLFLIAGPEY